MAAQPAKAAGAAAPVVVATIPNAVLAPGARELFQPASETVAVPSAAVVRVPFHAWGRGRGEQAEQEEQSGGRQAEQRADP